MVEADQVGAQLAGPPLGRKVVRGSHKEPAARTLFCRVRESEGGSHVPVPAEERAAALVRVSLNPMLTDGVRDACLKLERH
jgi:hypothetical protein